MTKKLKTPEYEIHDYYKCPHQDRRRDFHQDLCPLRHYEYHFHLLYICIYIYIYFTRFVSFTNIREFRYMPLYAYVYYV